MLKCVTEPLCFYKEPHNFFAKNIFGQKLIGSFTCFNKFVWIPNITVSYPEDDSDRRSKHVVERTVSDENTSCIDTFVDVLM